MPKRQTRKQVAYLMSKDSPLTPAQKKREKRELKSGHIKVKKKPSHK